MKLTVYILKERSFDNEHYTECENIKTTIYWHVARDWEDSANSPLDKSRSFDIMQVEIPDDMIIQESK